MHKFCACLRRFPKPELVWNQTFIGPDIFLWLWTKHFWTNSFFDPQIFCTESLLVPKFPFIILVCVVFADFCREDDILYVRPSSWMGRNMKTRLDCFWVHSIHLFPIIFAVQQLFLQLSLTLTRRGEGKLPT